MTTSRFPAVAAALVVLCGLVAPIPTAVAEPATVPVVRPTVLATIPHDPDAYTEGFEVDGDTLYEATGRVGKSELRDVDPVTGVVRRAVRLPANYWSEGITVVGDRIWQLTYQDGVAIEWDKATLTRLREVPFPENGWGICADGDRFIVTDGSGSLRFHDMTTLAQTGGVDVTRDGLPVTGLNEVDCVDGQVWASLWPTDEVARIDPTTGTVNLVVDMSELWQFGERVNGQVFSGIAHVAGNEFLVDGKLWPVMYRIRIDEA